MSDIGITNQVRHCTVDYPMRKLRVTSRRGFRGVEIELRAASASAAMPAVRWWERGRTTRRFH